MPNQQSTAELLSHRQATQAERDAYVLRKSAKTAAVWTTGACVLSYLFQNTWPKYQRLNRPVKLSLILSVATGAFFVQADIATLKTEEEFQRRNARAGVLIGLPSETAEARYEREKARAAMSWLDWARENRYYIVGYTWAGVMAGALAYNFNNRRIPLDHKLINARLIAQASVLAMFAGVVSLTGIEDSRSYQMAHRRDPHYDQIVHPELFKNATAELATRSGSSPAPAASPN
ncbi:hypothetical protein CXG81DRAFT_13889 [Caulochytrium protostelioides]|uniref:HIG1 domain-containing protein n=1 Tax=Caulochytrium protostelioides TaxID=1555241 RepID=A0A4P9X4C4_9FUNG|nr:hypothetical protein CAUPRSCDRAFT_5498 [Caulochytrium protostelioides]RKO99890.1 hypothetical protein CXG81DRAFT_13889 [Caulochytrium protostelioides]|eukprot:RKO99890.1 hypothetical protein CXG81DRAFT_13889 [Caulochytrium protostelioides]